MSKKQSKFICKWYYCCPIKFYTEKGSLDEKWIKNYCLKGSQSCIRYQMEAEGKPHSDQMLPDGTIDETLQ